MTLDLTQGAVSEKLNAVGQTELLHLGSGTLVNDRVLNLQDTAATVKTTALRESAGAGGAGAGTWLLEIRMPLLAISSIR